MKNNILIIFGLILFSGCVKNLPKVDAPSKAVLSFPAQNAACTTGTVISATQSTITFTWNSSANANSYELNIKNLLTGAVTSQTATTNQLAVDLLRDTPYSWYVTSKSSQTTSTTNSDTWKFYNAGLGTLSHPPFPADGLKPTFAQNVTATGGTINLSWTGSDPDNDIAGYDVYFGTSANPAILKSSITDMFLNGVAVSSGVTYYWKIVTKDIQGNISDSGIFQFKTN
jgi:hypothetical protein